MSLNSVIAQVKGHGYAIGFGPNQFFFSGPPTVARRDSRVLSQRQSGAGGLQAGHEDGRQHPEGAVEAAAHPGHP